MPLPRRQYGFDRHLHVAIGAILEADGHREARCKLAMHLAFNRARADRPPAHKIREELAERRVEEFGAGRQPQIGNIGKELAREAQPLVDSIGTIEIRIVDEALPAHDRPRLFEVNPHDDENACRGPCPPVV